MTDTDEPRKDQPPAETPEPGDPERGGPMGAIEGADAGALGMSEPPESAPPGAEVDDSEHMVPGGDFEEAPIREAKPWFTSLAAESDQAGVGNEPPEAEHTE
ncbi:MAG: hypothetical protein ACRDGV_12130 [Candidatus Limnocylindria bacterium]